MSFLEPGAFAKDDLVIEDLPVEKTAVALLQNLAINACESVEYDWDSVGPEDQSGFICRVTVAGDVYIGAGNNKRAAKQSAARAAYLARDCYAATPEPTKTDPLTPDGQNPISVLNELIAKYKLPVADYVVIEERIVGVGHRKSYNVGCHVGKLLETGSGLSKKVARQAAALKMLEKLKQEDKLQELFPDHRLDEPLNRAPGKGKNLRARVSPYPGTTRPFPEHRRGPTAQTLNTAPGKNEQPPLAGVLPNTGPIRPPMGRAQEMNPPPGYNAQPRWTRGPLNTATIRPWMGNHHSAQELGGNARFPVTQAPFNSGTMGNHHSAQELGGNARFPVTQAPFNSGTMGNHHSAQELGGNAQFPVTQAPFNSGTMGNHHSAQELGGHARFPVTQAPFNSGTMGNHHSSQEAGGNARFPVTQAPFNSGAMGNHNAQELGGNAQFPVIPAGFPVTPGPFNSGAMGNRNAHELGGNAQFPVIPAGFPVTPGPFNSVTMGNHHSAQELGGNAWFPVTPASLNSGTMGNYHNAWFPVTPASFNSGTMDNCHNAPFPVTPASFNSGTIRVLLASQHDPGAQELNSVQGNDEEYIWARVSKSTGKAMLFLAEKADPNPEEMNTHLERNAVLRGHFVTLNPAGTMEFPLEILRNPSACERNAAPGTDTRSSIFASPNPIKPEPHLDDSRESNTGYPLTLGKNSGVTLPQSSLSVPEMFRTGLANWQDRP